jgi:hypothetical protein
MFRLPFVLSRLTSELREQPRLLANGRDIGLEVSPAGTGLTFLSHEPDGDSHGMMSNQSHGRTFMENWSLFPLELLPPSIETIEPIAQLAVLVTLLKSNARAIRDDAPSTISYR